MTDPLAHVASFAEEGEREPAHQWVMIDNQYSRHVTCSKLFSPPW
ncbi:hypothetical protein [Erythrobacter sp. SDW2]|nr:hypothetical protein [Erythrobacter sp. SDW2]